LFANPMKATKQQDLGAKGQQRQHSIIFRLTGIT